MRGGAIGLASGGLYAAMNNNASYLWKGALYGAAFDMTWTGLKIAVLGPTFIPTDKGVSNVADIGQRFRRGWLPGKGEGFTFFNDVSVNMTGDPEYDTYLLNHETRHVLDIQNMGGLKFYARWLSEDLKYSDSMTGNAAYWTPGTLENNADYYAFRKLGYYFNSSGTYESNWP